MYYFINCLDIFFIYFEEKKKEKKNMYMNKF